MNGLFKLKYDNIQDHVRIRAGPGPMIPSHTHLLKSSQIYVLHHTKNLLDTGYVVPPCGIFPNDDLCFQLKTGLHGRLRLHRDAFSKVFNRCRRRLRHQILRERSCKRPLSEAATVWNDFSPVNLFGAQIERHRLLVGQRQPGGLKYIFINNFNPWADPVKLFTAVIYGS